MPSKTVQLILDISAEQYAYLKMLAAEVGLTLEEFILQCLPHPDHIRQAEEIMDRNREVLKKLSE